MFRSVSRRRTGLQRESFINRYKVTIRRIPKWHRLSLVGVGLFILTTAQMSVQALASSRGVQSVVTTVHTARDSQTQGRNPSVEIRIDTNRPVLKLYRRGVLYKRYDVALGKPSTPSPIGKWKVVDKQKNWGGGFGTRWLGLNVPWGTYGIHGTNRPELIGKYVSNGCIRMRNADVEQLYDLVPVGTPVIISGNPIQTRRTLTFGNIGADVLLVQHRLQDAGYYTGKFDGRFSGETQFWLSLYELAHHLPMDGMVGPDDYQALGLI